MDSFFSTRILPAFFIFSMFILLAGCLGDSPSKDVSSQCIENWKCGEWSGCIGGVESRACLDESDCGTSNLKPVESRDCSSCAGITCPDKCSGSTRLTNGSCSNGECNYSAEEYSTACGYSAGSTSGLEFETTLKFCSYYPSTSDLDFFFTVRTMGRRMPEIGSAIWLVTSDSSLEKPFHVIEKDYETGTTLWYKSIFTGRPYKGEIWRVPNASLSKMSYKLIYCSNESTGKTCPASGGIILGEGNVLDECTEESNVYVQPT